MRHVHDAQIRRGELGSSISISDGDAWCGGTKRQPANGKGFKGWRKGGFFISSGSILRRLARCSAENNIGINRNHGEPKLTNDAPVHVRTHTQNPRQSSINSVRKENEGERAQRTRTVVRLTNDSASAHDGLLRPVRRHPRGDRGARFQPCILLLASRPLVQPREEHKTVQRGGVKTTHMKRGSTQTHIMSSTTP